MISSIEYGEITMSISRKRYSLRRAGTPSKHSEIARSPWKYSSRESYVEVIQCEYLFQAKKSAHEQLPMSITIRIVVERDEN
jgi:hypothetical protein